MGGTTEAVDGTAASGETGGDSIDGTNPTGPTPATTDGPMTSDSTGVPTTGSTGGRDGRCGDGTITSGELCYEPVVSAQLSGQPRLLAADDLDGDARPDLAIGYASPRVDVFWGARSGLGRPSSVDLSSGPDELVTADITNDGTSDLVIGTSGVGAQLQVARGRGGSLALDPALDLPDSGSLLGIGVRDLDRDALADLVVTGRDAGIVRVLIADGTGAFDAGDAYPVGQRPRRLILSDLDADGAADIIVVIENCFGAFNAPDAYCEPGALAVLAGEGDGTFAPSESYDLGIYLPREPVVGDFDGDGSLDVVVIAQDCYPESYGGPSSECTEPGRSALLRGDGAGGLAEPELVLTDPWTSAGAAADFDADGLLDVVVIGATIYDDPVQGEVRVLLNLGDGTFAAPIALGQIGNNAFDVAVADFNADGAPDIAATSYETQELAVWLSDP